MKKESKIVRLTESFWTDRYKTQQTDWNIGYASTPIVEYFNQVEDKNIRILIPGAGNSYEAEHLHQQGFKQVYVLDLSKPPLNNLSERCPGFPKNHLIHQNFFDHHLGLKDQYDVIIEQTFFCALDPELRQAYADQVRRLLTPTGKLIGLWFDIPLEDNQERPPFGGTVEEYKSYFRACKNVSFDNCYNSIEPRQGQELFGIIVNNLP